MKIITVVPIAKGIPRDELTYFSAKAIPAGTLVSAPFGNRTIKAVVIHQDDVRDLKSSIKEQSYRLRNITTVHADTSLAPAIFYATQKTSDFFVARPGALLETMIPAPLFAYYSTHPTIPQERHIVHANIQTIQVPYHERISIYKTLIRENLAKHVSTLIVVPSVIHAESLKEHLETGIAERLITLHSKKTKKYLTEKIEWALTQKKPIVVIATAPFGSLVRDDWDTIIIEESSSTYYRYTFGPHFDMRYFVEHFAKYLGSRLIYADTLLDVGIHERLERRELFDIRTTWHIKKPEDFSIINAKEKLPEVPGKLVTKKYTTIHPNTASIIARDTSPESHFLFITTRKGLAPLTSCSDCGTVVTCPNCEAPLVLHRKKGDANESRIYMCHHCMTTTTPIDHCLNCNSWKLTPLGISTETTAQELSELFPDQPLFICDGEMTPTQITQEISNWKKSKRGILIGTSVVLPYIDTVSFGCIVSLDTLLSIPTHTGSEHALHTALHVLEKITRTAVIQTRSVTHDVITAIKDESIYEFVKTERATRKQFGYPPSSLLIKITFTVPQADAKEAHQYFEKIFDAWHPDILIKRAAKPNHMLLIIIMKTDPAEWNTPNNTLKYTVKEVARDALVEINPDGIL